MPDSPRQCSWLIRKAMASERASRSTAAPFDSKQASIIGPDTEPVSVVEESRLREVEAELARANKALEECARLSGADLSDGFPTSPSLPDFAVQEVKQMRQDHDEDDTYDLYRQALKDNADFAMRVERLEVDLQEATAALQWIETRLSRHREPRVQAIDKALERARGVLRKGDTDAR